MKIVPLKRLLIQPTVQLSWLKQHGCIEFELDRALQAQFGVVWQQYRASDCRSLNEFLNSETARPFELYEHDHLYALLVGADYILARYPNFKQRFECPNLEWDITA